jgi:hypothetical protein
MNLLVRTAFAAAGAAAIGCSHDIPPPVMDAPSKRDARSADPNPANHDPNLRPPFGPFDVQTVFYISKSNDKDRVDYGMRLDQHCAPIGDNSVFPYWRELQNAPPVRSHPLKYFQYMAYGFSEQRVLAKSRAGGKYLIRLKQVDRPIVIVTEQDENRHCTASAYVKVQGLDTRLEYIFAKVAGVMSVDYVDVHAVDPTTGRELVERLTP